MRRHRPLRIVLLVIAGVLVAAVVAFLVWANTPMRAEPDALADAASDDRVVVSDVEGSIVLTPAGAEPGVGLVFIPGARVEAEAYERVLLDTAAAGVTVVIPRPTLNLAFFDTRSLDDLTAVAPAVDEWAVGGHSLGGVRACQLADDALVLFGSYCADDLADTDVAVLSISGTADGLSTPEKIADNRAKLPADAELVELEGANHADFGDYGPQPGDGDGTLPTDAVRAAITDALVPFLQRLG